MYHCQMCLQSGETALHFSAKFGHAGIAKILISAKGKLSNQNKVIEINVFYIDYL